MLEAVLLSLGAGLAITLGAFIASFERIRPQWLEREFRHFVIALGGGALLSAVGLVLVPEGIAYQTHFSAALTFLGGGLAFMGLDIWLARRKGSVSQLVAMMLDFIPEAIVLGAIISTEHEQAVLIAIIIAAQNLPEGFNAYREICQQQNKQRHMLLPWFMLIGLTGPLYALLGAAVFSEMPSILGMLMTFSAGGILYIVFQDIAPQAKLARHWLPTLGAVLGFLIGMIGFMATGG